jgi:hypothetical protein
MRMRPESRSDMPKCAAYLAPSRRSIQPSVRSRYASSSGLSVEGCLEISSKALCSFGGSPAVFGSRGFRSASSRCAGGRLAWLLAGIKTDPVNAAVLDGLFVADSSGRPHLQGGGIAHDQQHRVTRRA